MHETRRNSEGEVLPPRRPDEPDYDGKLAGEVSSSGRCPLLGEDEVSNPYVASCGEKFDTYEAFAHHERKHREARERIEGVPPPDYYPEIEP